MFPVADEEGDVVARIKTKIKELILKLARKNRSWGYPRIQGALTHLRPDASRGTIAKGLKVNELEPALTRGGVMTWRGFLKAYWKVLTAKDYFTVEVWTGRGLVRYLALIVIRLAPRVVEMAGVVSEQTQSWMLRIARNLTDP
jgi:hypothetical protein